MPPAASVSVPRAIVRLPVSVDPPAPGRPDLLMGAERVRAPAPSFTRPAVPLITELMSSEDPVSTWNTPWVAPSARTGTVNV